MNRITAIGLWDVLKKAGHAFLKDKVPKYFAIKFGSEIKPNAFTTVIKNVQVESENSLPASCSHRPGSCCCCNYFEFSFLCNMENPVPK
jgi:hypothetical protein